MNRKDLTARERETMQLFADGLTRIEVMRALEISESGLYQRTSSVRAKLEQDTLHGAVFILGWRGWVEAEPTGLPLGILAQAESGPVCLPIGQVEARVIDLLTRGVSIQRVAVDAGWARARVSKLWRDVMIMTTSRTKERLSARWGATLRANYKFQAP